MPYRDVVGIWTDCFGRTQGVKPGVAPGRAKCETYLAQDIKRHADGMMACVFVDVPVVSLSALISFGFNVGVRAFCGSTLARKLNAGDLEAACNELPKWNKAGGVVWNGLVNRRAAERALCLQGLQP